jgi:cytochrome c nitrite reductase small subunit
MAKLKRYKFLILILFLFVFAIGSVAGLEGLNTYTSSDEYCMSCHVHPHAESSWKQSSHFNNKSGVVVHCVDCHLPPKDNIHYWPEKIKAASRDLYAFWFTDHASINWDQKSQAEHAKRHTFNESCINCHENLFPLHLSKKGDEAHLYYKHNKNKLDCINCHLNVGHGGKNMHKANTAFLKSANKKEIYTQATNISNFANFTENIPGTDVDFNLIAIAGNDSIPQFFMAETEVCWDEYKAFLSETESEGRSIDSPDVDAISGATPPFGDPSQAWGMGKRPAITMTWHAAHTYCRWLSKKTGKHYRLPTRKEWIHACNANSKDEFFFGGSAEDYRKKGFPLNLFKQKNTTINEYVIWKENSNNKTALPLSVKGNDLGLKNMLGNVKEFCSDTISINGKKEHLIIGGSFKSQLNELLPTYTDHTKHDDWLITDPQIPKSIWWYSDCNDVGFRVVCEHKTKTEQ